MTPEGEPAPKTYQCDSCGGTFDEGWTDEEAIAEMEEHFGDVPTSERARVCDDCYQRIMGRS